MSSTQRLGKDGAALQRPSEQAAPQIPNLLDSLRNRRTARGEGASGLLGAAARKASGNGPSSDAAIQQTDDDAAGSRLSAVDIGYLNDPFAHAFTLSKTSVRRMPIINRGTYVRTTAIDTLVDDFLDAHTAASPQIISLGAGTDTRPFRLLQQQSEFAPHLLYHEIDFPECTSKKITGISNAKLLPNAEKHISSDGARLTSAAYQLHALDLRAVAGISAASSESGEINSLSAIDPVRPTLILSECCLTYLSSSTSVEIVQHFVRPFLASGTPVSIILYEPLNPSDAFGKTMTSNLAARGISLPGLSACPTVDAHRQRLEQCGFEMTGGTLVREWWHSRVHSNEKERLRSLEGLDEEEEWELLAGHYGFIWGSSNNTEKWPKE